MYASFTLRRALLIALPLAAIFACAVAPGVHAAATKAKPACRKLRESQTRTVTFKYHYEEYSQKLDPNHVHVYKKHYFVQEDTPYAVMQIGGATCKGPKGWKVVDPAGVGFDSRGLTAEGERIGDGRLKGWGIGLKSGQGGSAPRLKVRLLHCNKGHWLGVVKFLNGVPIPGLKYAVGVAQWGLGKVLPDDAVKCANRGTVMLRITADAHGTMQVSATNHGTAEYSYSATDTTSKYVGYTMSAPEVTG